MKLSEIITRVTGRYGAPIGRPNVGKKPQVRVYDRKVPLTNDGYDHGGAYWGIGSPLRVRYTKDLSYVEFYRV